jgi:hypothetical protein
MNSDAATRLPVRAVIEALAAACGLDEAEMPSDAPGLVLERAEGLVTLIRPHPIDDTKVTVEIESADASAVAQGTIDGSVARRALEAMLDLGASLEECSDWALGLDDDRFVLSAAFGITAFRDTEHALAMIQDGQARAHSLAAAWEGLLRRQAD